MIAATGVRQYATDAEFFFRQHQQTEIPLTNGSVNPTYYIPNYDNSAWAAAIMLDDLLGLPIATQQMLNFFSGWMQGKDLARNNVLMITPRWVKGAWC